MKLKKTCPSPKNSNIYCLKKWFVQEVVMFIIIEKVVLGMAFLRLISGSIEIFAAILMIKFNTVEKALMVNSSLSLIGPIILVLTTSIGLLGIVEKISIMKFVWIALGVSFIFVGVKS
jgi:hypothetical protein